MDEPTDAAIDAALHRGRLARPAEPRAAAVRYDVEADRVVVELTNGCVFMFPPRLAEGLETASPDELVGVSLAGTGYGLHWEALDVDLSLPGLMAGMFGSRAHLARQGGTSTSPVKAAAARANGARGGRPRKSSHA